MLFVCIITPPSVHPSHTTHVTFSVENKLWNIACIFHREFGDKLEYVVYKYETMSIKDTSYIPSGVSFLGISLGQTM